MVDYDMPGAWPVWTPGVPLAALTKECIIHWSTQHMKALGHMVSKKIFLCFSHDTPGAGPVWTQEHGGDSIDTTCAVVRDVTAYIAVVRVLRFSSEYYGCRYHRCPYFSAHRANRSSLTSAFITENCQEGIYRYYKRLSSFLNIKTITKIYF